MRLTIPLLALLASLALPALAAPTDGETLLMPLPPPESGWATRSATLGNEEIAEWVRAETGDVAAARILRDRGQFPAVDYRAAKDAEAQGTCASYGSRELASNQVNGYPFSLWIAQCGLDATRAITVLHLYITGRDHGYYLTRKWRGTPNNDILGQWVDYFGAVGLCDTRAERNAPCPVAGQ
ncbi:MAG: hypothetical protein WDA10_11210 [Porticoccaceae bacterium]|nr:hypothetical protein [Porticoccaceae bacterium]MEA3301527.1 hypothetical protein [Pseudomonadota bacterium]HLS98300.1 hypothetical protein [Porticoccaceae bacterium]